ncbi:hypothetical protein [Treponema pectinovorum]|uniref:hypothetical protein n=1 Tax=Treponema pectinovorum TaxID=164 RepID=UPI0011CB6612|nr:hypothetical protein [Treponema pectinovorum]
MKVEHIEKAKNDSDCEIRLGQASWDSSKKSIKYTWFDINGKPTRGGEFPVEALPQMLDFAIRKGYISLF